MQTHSPLCAACGSGAGCGCKAQELFLSLLTPHSNPSLWQQSKLTPMCSKRKLLLSCHVPNSPLFPPLKEDTDMPFQSAPNDNLVETKPSSKIILVWFPPKPARNSSRTLITHYQEENPLLSSVKAIAEVKPSRTTQSLHLILASCHRDDNPDLWQPQRTASLNQDQVATPLSQ